MMSKHFILKEVHSFGDVKCYKMKTKPMLMLLPQRWHWYAISAAVAQHQKWPPALVAFDVCRVTSGVHIEGIYC